MTVSNINFFEIINDSPDVLLTVNMDGIVTYVNETFTKVTGHKKKVVVGKHLSEVPIFTKTSKKYVADVFPTLISESMNTPFELTLVDSMKKKRAYTIVPRLYPKEKPFLLLVFRDMYQEYQFEEKMETLLKKNKLYFEAIENSRVGIIITNAMKEDNPIVYVNKGFRVLTGYVPMEIIGRNCRFLQGEKSDPNTIKLIREAIKNEVQLQTEILNYKKDGSPFWNELSINPVRNDEGEVTHFIGIQQDITDRKRNEIEMKQDIFVARRLQEGLFSKPVTDEKISICGYNHACRHLGGDLYKWTKLDDHLYSVFIMDVMGHGITASLLTLAFNTKYLFLMESNVYHPKDFLDRLNDHMFTFLDETFEESIMKPYFSCTYLLVDTKAKKVHYVNAGHPSFIVKNKEQVDFHSSNSIPVGLLKDHVYEEESFHFDKDSEIILYTDGVLENLAVTKEMLAEMEINEKSMRKAETFFRLDKLEDDITLIHMKLH